MNELSKDVSGPRFETGRSMLIAGLNESYTYASAGAGIPAQWARFSEGFVEIPAQVGTYCYGVSWNFDGTDKFDYLCGIEVSGLSGLPEDYSNVLLPAQKYAVFSHTGHISTIKNSIDYIWRTWLPNSGYKPVHAPTFERYGESFCPDTGYGEVEMWVAIQS